MTFQSLLRRLVGLTIGRREEDSIFRAMVEQSSDVICHLAEGRFTYVSPSAAAIFGWSPSAMIGTDGLDLIFEPDLPILQEAIAKRAIGATAALPHQLRVLCADGTLKWSETSASSVLDKSGREARTILVIRDISERKRLEEALEVLALEDALTGLANRRAFDIAIERTWAQTLRGGGEMALVMIDIDFFKQFNDHYGHQAGDDCLRSVGAAIRDVTRRPGDLACRYGGEEFAVIVGDMTADQAMALAERMRAAVSALRIPHDAGTGDGHLTVSIGVATALARVGGSIRMPESLIQAADHALYRAKAGGRDRVEQSLLIAPSDQL